MRGKAVATRIEERTRALVQEKNLSLQLVIMLVGDNAASETYVRKKIEACERVGITARLLRLPADLSQQKLHTCIQELNADKNVTGYILQLPLPAGLSVGDAVAQMDPAKDVDGFTAANAGHLFLGTNDEFLPPATSHAVIELLEGYDIPLAGKHAVVVGRSNLVGKPLAMELLQRNATVTICHSKTPDLASFTRTADILISAVGKMHLITADMVQPGAVLVDVGFHKTSEGLFGDIHPDARAGASAYAPVPGGVGAVTVAQLIANVAKAHILFHS